MGSGEHVTYPGGCCCPVPSDAADMGACGPKQELSDSALQIRVSSPSVDGGPDQNRR